MPPFLRFSDGGETLPHLELTASFAPPFTSLPSPRLVSNRTAVTLGANVDVGRKLLLSNDTNEAICFKIKTTAPQSYCVRPNASIINAGQVLSVDGAEQTPPNTPTPQPSHCNPPALLLAERRPKMQTDRPET
eukprot:SAG22_NODE_5793_length_951_cov_1.497653_2_plen_133_part_00